MPVLELSAARAEGAALPTLALTLRRGELVVIAAPDGAHAASLADLCCGVLACEGGSARFLGHDWSNTPEEHAAALRGRIGRVFANGGWLPQLGMDRNVLLPLLYHTRLPEDGLRLRAARLAQHFGLPGLPLASPRDLRPDELARVALVRAFLGDPDLLLLESPLHEGRLTELAPALLDAIAAARSRGAACIWLSRSGVVWHDPRMRPTRRLRLSDAGLTWPAQAAAA